MQIGVLAKRAGVNVQTIRFYERERLLPEPDRTPSGYRRYSEGDLDKVRFIRDSQEMGFALKEIRQLVELHRSFPNLPRATLGRSAELRKIAALARERLQSIEGRLRLLKSMKRQLSAVLDQIEGTDTPTCPAPKRPDSPPPKSQ